LFELGSNKICHGVARGEAGLFHHLERWVENSALAGQGAHNAVSKPACAGEAESGALSRSRRRRSRTVRMISAMGSIATPEDAPIRSDEGRTAGTPRKRAERRPLRDSNPVPEAGAHEPEHLRDELPSIREGHEGLPPSSAGRARDRAFASQY